MEEEEAALQEEGGLSDMIDSLKANAAEGVDPTPEDEPTLEPEPTGEDEEEPEDTTDLSIDQKIFRSAKKARHELKDFDKDHSNLAEEIQANYAKQNTLL